MLLNVAVGNHSREHRSQSISKITVICAYVNNKQHLSAHHNNEKKWDYVSCCYFREPLCRHIFHIECKYLPL